MSFQINVFCFPWDLVDEGLDPVLDQLKGEAGATGVTLLVAAPPVQQLRAHLGVSPRVFNSAGGIQFQPEAFRYTNTRIRPIVASWLKKSNGLASVAKGCHERGLTLNTRIVGCHSPLIAQRYDYCAAKNVFLEINPNWLCPVNPDVREYLLGLAKDVAVNYEPQAIELEDFSFPASDHTRPPLHGIDIGPVGRWLLDLCFCESCRQTAGNDGVDFVAAANVVRDVLEKIFKTGEPLEMSLDEFLATKTVLGEIREWQHAQLNSLIAIIAESTDARLLLRVREDETADIVHTAHGLLVPCSLEERQIENAVRSAAGLVANVGQIELEFSAGFPDCNESAALVKAMAHAAKLGVRSFSIHNYGLIPHARLAWIKQAARYVQRELT